MIINTLPELKEFLGILRDAGVKQYNCETLQVTLVYDMVEGSEDDEEDEEEQKDTKSPTSSMGFETADYKTIGITTEFDE